MNTTELTPPGFEPRVEGRPWKGLHFDDGRLYTWQTKDRMGPNARPHHLEGLQALGYGESWDQAGAQPLGTKPFGDGYDDPWKQIGAAPLASPDTSYGHGPNILDALDHQSNILDPVHSTLDERVWDKAGDPDPVLKPHLAHWIITKVTEVLKRHGYEDMERWMSLFLTGSLTTYQYSDKSDCDVSIFVNSQVFPEWSRAEMIAIMVSEMDGVYLPGTPHELQVYVVSKELAPQDLYKRGLRAGYDIIKGKWLVSPDRGSAHDVEREMNASYTQALETADKMERLLRYEPEKAVEYAQKLHERRHRDQMDGKGDYAPSNVAWKMLSNRDLLPQINELAGTHY